MAIDFLEIRDKSRAVVGIMDTAKSVIWNIVYYGVGDFEIYAPFTAETSALLVVGNYVTRQNDRNIGIIERINVTYNEIDGRMIVATGQFGKSLLTRRLIYNLSGNSVTPVESRGNVEAAARALVTNNIISAKDTARNVDFIALGALAGLSAVIVDKDGDESQKQTSFQNLQEYTDGILQEVKAGAYMAFDRVTQKMLYTIYEGEDRSASNTAGNDPLIFSQDFDNLISTDYALDTQIYKNTALIGGAGEGTARYMELLTDGSMGIDRREVFVDASDQSRTYKDANDNEVEYTNAVYSQMIISKARQELTQYAAVETMSGAMDIANSGLTLGVDYYVGDIITVQDVGIGKYMNARIIKATEVQDDNGYNISVEFGE